MRAMKNYSEKDPFVRPDKKEFLTPHRLNNIRNKINYVEYLKASENINHHWESIIALTCHVRHVDAELYIEETIDKIIGYVPVNKSNVQQNMIDEALHYEVRKGFLSLLDNFIDKDFINESIQKYSKVYLRELFRHTGEERFDILILKKF